jgi:choline dehydrogenase
MDAPTSVPAAARPAATSARSLQWLRANADWLSLAMVGLVVLLVPQPHERTPWLVVLSCLIAGQLGAWWSWRWRPAVFAPGSTFTPQTLLAGLALALAAVMLLVPLQRTLHGALIELSFATPWEGLAAGFAWGILLLAVPALGLGVSLLWRALTHAVLEGRLSARVVHGLVWCGLVLAALGLASVAASVVEALAAASRATALTLVARRVSLFVGDYAVAMWTVYGVCVIAQLGLGFIIRPAPARLPPLVVITLRPPGKRPWGGAHELHRLACTWGESRGPVVLVRPAARATSLAGVHARWAWFAGRLDELFVGDAYAARRWCAAWLGPRSAEAPGLFVRECFVRDASALAPLVGALRSQHPDALFMLVLGATPDPVWLDELRHALPKRNAFTLAETAVDVPRVPRLSTLAGSLGSPAAVRKLVGALEQQMLAPPPQRRIAVMGRPRSDAAADRLVMALDQRKDAQGRLIDALRPARDDVGRHETLLLLLDLAWLAGEREARAEAAALTVLVASARRLAVMAEAEVPRPVLARALTACGWQREFDWFGVLPPAGELAAWTATADNIVGCVPVALPQDASAPGTVRLLTDPADLGFILLPYLKDALARHFGAERIFDATRSDVHTELTVAVLSRSLVLALQRGEAVEFRKWLQAELLRTGRVLPLLLNDAEMPREGLDPPLLHLLASRQALRLRTADSAQDLDLFVSVVARLLDRPAPPAKAAAPPSAAAAPAASVSEPNAVPDRNAGDWDYVIVGSGVGGGTLAARLVEEGMRVFLLEAGGDPRAAAPGLPEDYDVPAFHAFACENEAMSWNFRVRHYADETQQARDPKYQAGQGVLYPRAATLGGCTAHNAMIFMLPHDADWNHIAELTGDRSWRAGRMRRFAQKLEDCHHRPLWRALHRIGLDPTGHGWQGWLRTEKSMPLAVLGDDGLLQLVLDTAGAYTRSLPTPLASAWRWASGGLGDPNARRMRPGSFEGLCYTPLSTANHQRRGVRERLLDVAARHPGQLHIELDALATRVLLDAEGAAHGVEYLKGARLYRAHPNPASVPGARHEVQARREVILCGGAFNTPQLLMLSGIGPSEALRAHGIAVRVDLPGVGRNLQDRYEVAVTHRMRGPWKVLEGARFERDDPLWLGWNQARVGMYASNGAAFGVVRSSTSAGADPDLFCMALLAHFEGYYPGFSEAIRAHPDRLTWAVLKGHTRNRAGTVRLRSADPREMPLVNFSYFEEGDDRSGSDLAAVVDAIRFVRRMTAPLIASGRIAEELAPGPDVQTDEALADYVRNTAWGHHASCSCPIGAADQGGVLDSKLAVHGVPHLRVVDASAFPRIPGFFIAAAIYMLAEKAAEVVLEEARRTPLSAN